MAAFVDIRKTRPLLDMDKVDFQCVIEVMQRHLNKGIDLFGLLKTMKRNGLIDTEKFANLKQCILELRIRDFVPQVLSSLSFEHFCLVFEKEGYTNISAELRSKRFTILYKKPAQKKMPHSKRTHEYYKTLKNCTDNNSFRLGRRSQLRKFIQYQDEKILLTAGTTPHDRQFAMEKKAAATILLIQQYKDNEERKHILEQAIATETNGIDNASLEIIFHSKMALTEAQAGNVSKAEDHIVQTKFLCEMYGPCFAVTSAFHDIEYTYKSLYFMNPSDEMLEKVLSEGDIGIQSLNEEKEDVQNLWKRIMLLFMVLSLLFITPEFVVRDISKIKKVKKTQAKRILKEIKRCSDDIELRREMIMYLCLGALDEENDVSSAEIYLTLSLTAANNGGCFREIEKQNIEIYLKKIKRKALFYKLRKFVIRVLLSLGLFLATGMFAGNEYWYVFIGKAVITMLLLGFAYTYLNIQI